MTELKDHLKKIKGGKAKERREEVIVILDNNERSMKRRIRLTIRYSLIQKKRPNLQLKNLKRKLRRKMPH